MPLEKQKEEIRALGLRIEKKEEVKELPPLPQICGRVIMRFAPNPNGPLSLGHSRTALLNWFYVQKYDGDFILRFDDTDPKIKTPLKEAYDWILEDLRWLGIEPEEVVRQSDRLEIYYKYAEDLIKKGLAYVCTCSAESFRKLRNKKQPCPCREIPAEEQLVRWKNFFDRYREGQAVLRIKTDIADPNPALRDWPAMRIIDKPLHPLSKAKVWPLYDFASAIDDHELGITHIIRGREFEMSELKQGWIYRHFGWAYPANIVTGKFIVAGVKSTSKMREEIEAGKLSGWDDPRVATIMSLKKRGFVSEAIAQFIKAAGLTKGDVQVSIANLEAINRKAVDFKASRYFFVASPIEMQVEAKAETARLPLHPDDPKRGERILHFSSRVFVSKDDLPLLKKGAQLRLKDLFNIKVTSPKPLKAKFTSKPASDALKKKMPIIHWLPVEEKIPLTLIMPDGTEKKGFVEPACKDFKGVLVQFERVGFATVGKINKELIAYYTHR